MISALRVDIMFIIFVSKHLMGPQWNHLTKALPMSTHKLYFGAKITKRKKEKKTFENYLEKMVTVSVMLCANKQSDSRDVHSRGLVRPLVLVHKECDQCEYTAVKFRRLEHRWLLYHGWFELVSESLEHSSNSSRKQIFRDISAKVSLQVNVCCVY